MSRKIYLKGTSIKIKCSDIDIDENIMYVEWSEDHRYWMYKGNNYVNDCFSINKIYKIIKGKNIDSSFAFIDNQNEPDGFAKNRDFFTPVTKKQYKAQQAAIKQPEPKKEPVFVTFDGVEIFDEKQILYGIPKPFLTDEYLTRYIRKYSLIHEDLMNNCIFFSNEKACEDHLINLHAKTVSKYSEKLKKIWGLQ